MADPDKYIDGHAGEPMEMDAVPDASDKRVSVGHQETDPVCGMRVDRDTSTSYVHHGRTYYFCSPGCYESFVSDPGPFAAGPPAEAVDQSSPIPPHEQP